LKRRVVIEYREEMKEKLTEKYLFKYYRDYLLDHLHNLNQGYMSIQDYITTFENLIHRCDMREYRSQMITIFVSGLRSKIKRATITDSYNLNTVKEAINVALNIDLTFKRLVNANARCSECEGYEHYDYQCFSKSQHVSIVSSDKC